MTTIPLNGQVPWAHHPTEVKELLRAARIRPMARQCYHNSTRLFLAAQRTKLAERLEYREGWCDSGFAFTHAWLLLDGKPLDLTLPPELQREYLDCYSLPFKLVLKFLGERSGVGSGEAFPYVMIGLSPTGALNPKPSFMSQVRAEVAELESAGGRVYGEFRPPLTTPS